MVCSFWTSSPSLTYFSMRVNWVILIVSAILPPYSEDFVVDSFCLVWNHNLDPKLVACTMSNGLYTKSPDTRSQETKDMKIQVSDTDTVTVRIQTKMTCLIY